MSNSPTVFPNEVQIQGDLKVARGLTRANLAPELLQEFPIPLTQFRVWDAFQTLLTTAGTDDLGISAGAFGTGCPYITAGDLGAATATRYGRFMFQLPLEYDSGQAAALRFSAGMLTAVSDTTATLDVEAYILNRDTLKSGSDIVSTAAQSINSLTFADYDFSLGVTNLSPGTWLDVRVAIAVVDSATAVAEPAIAAAEAVLSIRG